MAVGTVSNVDLPLNEVLGAIVQATGSELLERVGTEAPSAIKDGPGQMSAGGATDGRKILQGTAYKFLCEFMQEVEPSEPPPPRWSTCLSCHSPSVARTPPTCSVSWKDSMVQVRNRKRGWVWVLKENKDAYLCSQQDAPPASARPPFS